MGIGALAPIVLVGCSGFETDRYGNETRMKSVVQTKDGRLHLIVDLWFRYLQEPNIKLKRACGPCLNRRRVFVSKREFLPISHQNNMHLLHRVGNFVSRPIIVHSYETYASAIWPYTCTIN